MSPRFNRLSPGCIEIPVTEDSRMHVPARVYADEVLAVPLLSDRSLEQLMNVAMLPHIIGAALGMPDIHQGYGFPIGGVAAFSMEEGGLISPGGVGYDINCGVRLLTGSSCADIPRDSLERIISRLAVSCPRGGGKGAIKSFCEKSFRRLLSLGAEAAVEEGFGTVEDLGHCEDGGRLPAGEEAVSLRAMERGRAEAGSLGGGNHFLEMGRISALYDEETARAWGLFPGQITLMIHCGSRGLGHQVCSEYVRLFQQAKGPCPDRELAWASAESPQGKRYIAAMNAAANFAYANRHILGAVLSQILSETLWKEIRLDCDFRLLYDITHNMAREEVHTVSGRELSCMVHRKGATRAFPASRMKGTPFEKTGHPVFIPGSMGSSSYILRGTEKALGEAFGSSCHGAGRVLSRREAVRRVDPLTLVARLAREGIIVKGSDSRGLAEEAPQAYKDVSRVTALLEQEGLAVIVARLEPLGVVKG